MISHTHKVIFIHIPRTAGTAIENWLAGDDWWNIEPGTKHLIASQAKTIYAPYWDEYYKFSIVRHPLHRILSHLKFGSFYGISVSKSGRLDLTGYLERFEYRKSFLRRSVIIEHDRRFHELGKIAGSWAVPRSVYSNILNEQLDCIFKYEELHDLTKILEKKLGCAPFPLDRKYISSTGISAHRKKTLEEVNRKKIFKLLRKDYTTYGYKEEATF